MGVCVCVMGEFELLLLLLLDVSRYSNLGSWRGSCTPIYSGVIPSSHQFFPWRLSLNSIHTVDYM